jgi:hypothetical protein
VGEIVLDMSATAWILACVKLTVLLLTVSMRISFAWKLVMNTGVSRMELQRTESIKSAKWAQKKHHEELESAKSIDEILKEVREELKEQEV